jgi:hypothetical protein
MLSINDVPCHEFGCPNRHKTWVEDRQEWAMFKGCFYCGYDVEIGTSCGCCAETGGEDSDSACK